VFTGNIFNPTPNPTTWNTRNCFVCPVCVGLCILTVTVPVMTLVAATLPVAQPPELCNRRRKFGLMALYERPSTRIRFAGHLTHMGERRGKYRIWYGNLRERDHLEGPDVEGTIILR